MQNLKLGLVQMDIVWENTPANIEKIDGLLNGMTDLDLIMRASLKVKMGMRSAGCAKLRQNCKLL